jgi:hypothetical protein
MGFYSAIKKNGILSFADKWIELEKIILSEVSQVLKVKGYMLNLMLNVGPITYNQYYVYIEIYTECVSTRGLVEETKGEGKKRKIVNNYEVHCICVGTRYKETQWKLFNNTG